jgi:hypothetical protein
VLVGEAVAFNHGQARGLYLARKWALEKARELRALGNRWPSIRATYYLQAMGLRSIAATYKVAGFPLK